METKNDRQNYQEKSKEVGLPPGTLIHVGEKKSDVVRIRQIISGDSRRLF
jgi:hypothetical protein